MYGPTRSTGDIDIVWRRTPETEQQLTAALIEANAQWISNERDPKTNMERLVLVSRAHVNCEHLMMSVTDYGFVDLFDFVPGLPSADVDRFFADSVLAQRRRFASLDWLKRMKQAAGRPKDLDDLRQLP